MRVCQATVVLAWLSIRSHFGHRPLNSNKPAQRDDDSVVGSYSYPFPTVLGGVPGRVPSYRLLSPLHTGGRQAARMGDTLSPLHQRGGNRTRTKTKLSRSPDTIRQPVCSSPGYKASFEQTDRTPPSLLMKRSLIGVSFQGKRPKTQQTLGHGDEHTCGCCGGPRMLPGDDIGPPFVE